MKIQKKQFNGSSQQFLNKIPIMFCLLLTLAIISGCSGSTDSSTKTAETKTEADFPEHTAEEITSFMESKPKEILGYTTSDPKGYEEKNFKEYQLKNVRYAVYEKEFTADGEKGVVTVDVYVGSISSKKELNEMVEKFKKTAGGEKNVKEAPDEIAVDLNSTVEALNQVLHCKQGICVIFKNNAYAGSSGALYTASKEEIAYVTSFHDKYVPESFLKF